MDSFIKAIRSPGAMLGVTETAPSRMPRDGDKAATIPDSSTLIKTDPGYTLAKKEKLLDRWLDNIVRASGSTIVFSCIQLGLWAWVFAGAGVAHDPLWPVLISDVQAILSYAFDSCLMRQQFNGYYESLTVAAEIQSRGLSVRRMFRDLAGQVGPEGIEKASLAAGRLEMSEFQLPEPTRWTKAIQGLASIIGHVGFVVFYWATIILWLAFGPANDWSNQWQLDINSATSALMVFIFSFLAILRERHSDYIRACIDAIYRVDSTLELKLRVVTNDQAGNLPVVIPALRMNRVQRIITYYADVVGALTGVALLIVVFVAWLAIGPVLNFDTNWWLLIGTYAGLVGLIDGFVLRNVQTKLQGHEEPQYVKIDVEDRELFASLNIPQPSPEPLNVRRISFRVSQAMGRICGHEIMVVAGLLLVFGLLTGASVMRWSETGQLLCNIPPSVIESFFMIILITGHNAIEAQRRVDLKNIFERRSKLLSVVDAASGLPPDSSLFA
ncbi:hypothetical protein M409DRAFT_70498 [Zasmidium cellare ATCC 36951]|uniref:Low affinity iron permease n=1 Tax=Zasmidium cellare ATCC 36951 TaxID=1080233 RepID=A0A6A6BZU9_ZASCE|nr:uncharacterized protein M409DRAFT_70498 [Zasmidium cellare ATCC 36951]KAF2160327.1 hypothetical protein M409DRAFT_70498 [Zasmidium cellare ATCC 36951]